MTTGVILGNILINTLMYVCHYYVVVALLGHNHTDVPDMTNQYDLYVRNSTLNELTGYVRLNFFLWDYFIFFYSTAHY